MDSRKSSSVNQVRQAFGLGSQPFEIRSTVGASPEPELGPGGVELAGDEVGRPDTAHGQERQR